MQYSHLFGFPPLCLFKCLVKTFVRLFEFSPVCFSYVSSNDITGKKQSHTSCICSKFLHCTFSKASSNCQRERRHIRIGCIFLFFLHFVYLNVWSNCLPGRMQGHSCYIWLAFLQCVVSGQNVSLEGCKLTLVTLFFSYVSSNGMTGRMQSHTSCICPIFLHRTFSKVSSNCLPERRHICIGCIFWLFSTVSIQMNLQIICHN